VTEQKRMREFKSEVLKMLNQQITDNSKMELRIVSWNDGAPKLEKRRYYKDRETNQWKVGKLTGLDKDDLDKILAVKDEVLQLMGRKGK